MDDAYSDMYSVYVKIDDAGRVVAINSSAFLPDPVGWIKIDEGTGAHHRHAQGNYLPMGLIDERGLCYYKLVDNMLVTRTAEEMDADVDQIVVSPTHADRLAALEADTHLLLEAVGDQEYRICLMELGVTDSELHSDL